MREDLISILQKFESDYKGTLNKYEDKVPSETWNLLYDLGADIKHALDAFAEKID